MKKRNNREIKDYDYSDTTTMIDKKKTLTLKDVGVELPPKPPTQAISNCLSKPLPRTHKP